MDRFASSVSSYATRPASAGGYHHDRHAQPPPGLVKPIAPVCPDAKPRLTKEQHDILEAHFQQQHKPSTTTKKGFAESLGVPLDKINNWFQNRRAKVKQDLKKQTNQYNLNVNMMQLNNQQVPMPHMPQQAPPPPQDFYQQSIELSPSHHPIDGFAAQHSQEIATGQLPTSDFNGHGHVLSSISESAQPASYDAVMQSLVNAGYPMQSSNPDGATNGLPGHEQYTPWIFPDASKSMTSDQHFGFGPDFLTAGSPFGDDLGDFGADGLDFSVLSSSAPGSMASATPASVSTANSPFSTTHSSVPQLPTGSNGTASLPSGQSAWVEDPINMPMAHREVSQESTVSDRSVPPSSNTMWMPHHFRKPDMYQQSNASSQTFMSSPPEQADSQNYQISQPDFERPFTFSDEAFDRRDSPAAGLAQSMGNVELQAHTPKESEFKQPIQPSSLAARRQRPRPAALGAEALRSASYTGGMPTSPGANQNLNVDHTLRRIRSTGVVNGRIQKSTPGSAQRSPLAFTFAEAAASPKFAVQASGFPTTSNGNTSGSLAPPTPLTPNEAAGRVPYWQSPNCALKRDATHDPSHVEGSGVVYSMAPSSAASFAASPPETPLSFASLYGNRANMSNGPGGYRDTPPQSAPASQQCFPRSMYVPQNLVETPTSMEFNPSITQSCYRRPSLPDVGYSMGYDMPGQFAVPMVNTDGNLQLAHPTQFSQDQTGNFQKHAMMNYGQDMNGMMAGPVQPPNNMQQPDFQVHEYSPPQAAGHGLGRRQQEAQPKAYLFANQTPNDFKA